jgi:hypothetical protein
LPRPLRDPSEPLLVVLVDGFAQNPVGVRRHEHGVGHFSADETTDIGRESGTTVTPDYSAQTSRFTGRIHWVQLDLGTDDHDHLIDPEDRLRIAMARQ